MAKHNDKQQRLVNDAAKSLLANIRFMSIDNPIRLIVVTSTIPNEGKSFVAINLAQAIASSGKTCLIVEADLRKRTLAAAMGIHPEHGIYTVLSGSDLKDVAVATPQRNLYFLDAEPQIPNPPDLLSSRRYVRFLETAVNSFDYVVIDTPPVGRSLQITPTRRFSSCARTSRKRSSSRVRTTSSRRRVPMWQASS